MAKFEDVDDADDLELPEDAPVEVDEEGIPSADPELEGTIPVFADQTGDEDEEEEEEQTASVDERENFYQKGKAPSYESLARELRHKSRDMEILQARFDQVVGMLGSLQSPQVQKEDSEQEQAPDPNEDPVGFLNWKLEQIERNQQLTRQEQEYEKQQARLNAAFHQADSAVSSYRESVGGEAYDEAIDYLVDTTVAELEALNPNKTRAEIIDHVSQGINRQKLQWVQSGLNPGEMWYRVAQGRGWRPGTYWQRPQQQERTGRVKNSNPRQQIQQMKTRQKKARTVGKMSGAGAGGKLTARKALMMDEEQWNKATAGMGLRDLLADKARPGS